LSWDAQVVSLGGREGQRLSQELAAAIRELLAWARADSPRAATGTPNPEPHHRAYGAPGGPAIDQPAIDQPAIDQDAA
jgi:hypothetical protein